jgi:hypothetical protein
VVRHFDVIGYQSARAKGTEETARAELPESPKWLAPWPSIDNPEDPSE